MGKNSREENVVQTLDACLDRLTKILDVCADYGGTDGSHHKQYAIDRIVRIATGCKLVEKTSVDSRGVVYYYRDYDESDAYRAWVAEYCRGEDGPITYSWDTGIPG